MMAHSTYTEAKYKQGKKKKIKKSKSSKATSYFHIKTIESLRHPLIVSEELPPAKIITSGLSYLRHNEKFNRQ